MKRKKGKLTEAQKAFVVQRLACWDTPAEAAAALRDEHGVELAPQSCEAYDPNKRAGRNMAKKWRDLFDATRKAFMKDIETHVPEANKGVRIRRLATAARAFQGRGNWVGMADMLERIAKEMGNVHTNRREISGKDGKPIEHKHTHEMSDEQLNTELALVLKEAGMDANQVLAVMGAGRGGDSVH